MMIFPYPNGPHVNFILRFDSHGKEALRSSGSTEFPKFSSSGMHQELVSTGNVRK